MELTIKTLCDKEERRHKQYTFENPYEGYFIILIKFTHILYIYMHICICLLTYVCITIIMKVP